jgi:hypothetical protein
MEEHGQCGIANPNGDSCAIEARAQITRWRVFMNIAIKDICNGAEDGFERIHSRLA